MDATSNSKMKFADFYSDIKGYFVAHPEEYKRFRKCDTVRKKLAYLVQNGMVRKKLGLLKKSKMSDKRMPEYVPSAKRDWRKSQTPLHSGSKRFPQLTCKAKVTDSNSAKGRCVVATESILPGEVIIYERPYAVMVYPECSDSHCQLCFKSLGSDKISCQRCQKVFFCSAECHDLCLAGFHSVECDGGCLSALQSSAEVSRTAVLAVRIILEAGFEQCIETERRSAGAPEGEGRLLEEGAAYDSLDYAPAFLQVTHEGSRAPGEHFRLCVTALYLLLHLDAAGFFPAGSECEFLAGSGASPGIMIASLLVRHLESCSCNAYAVSDLVSTGGSKYENLGIGSAVYPTVSLTNHSCAQNTMRYHEGNACVLRASLAIEEGEEILDNYGFFYQMHPLSHRRLLMERQYFFRCECRACAADWPTALKIMRDQDMYLCMGCATPLPSPETMDKCTNCGRDLAGLDKFVRSMSEFDRLAKEGQQDALSHLLQEMEKWLKMPNFKFIQCQQIFVMRLTQGARKLR